MATRPVRLISDVALRVGAMIDAEIREALGPNAIAAGGGDWALASSLAGSDRLCCDHEGRDPLLRGLKLPT